MNAVLETAEKIGKSLSQSNLANGEDIKASMDVLKSTPLPTTRDEAWKYTRVAKLGKIDFQNRQSEIDNAEKYLIDNNAVSFVFVNGHFSNVINAENLEFSYTIIDKSNVAPKIAAKINGEVFNAINNTYLNGGLILDIPAKKHIQKPIQIIHILDGDQIISNFRTVVNTGESSNASIIQGFYSLGDTSFCNCINEISVAANANLILDKIQFENESTFHIGSDQVSQAKDSTFSINTFTLNGGLVRNNLNIKVEGKNCVTNLNGAYVLKNKQHIDNHTIVDHKVAHCESHELYKGVIDDKATAVFNGKVYVRKDAQKINAFQSNGNVLLSDDGTVNSKPELEIYADDVKCSHGSTTGQLDEEAIYYLRSRGISEKSAKQLMIGAFIGDVLEKVENKTVLQFIENKLSERFDWSFS